MNKMTIYLAGPISGCSYDEVVGQIERIKAHLEGVGYQVLHPMTGKSYLRNELEFKAHNYKHPVSSNHAIVERDRWMVGMANVIYANLMKARRVSIGSVMELAWAHQLGKHTIVAMEPENIHMHAFMLEAADIVFTSEQDAIAYLEKLPGARI